MKEFLKTKNGMSGAASILFALFLTVMATTQLGNEELWEANGTFIIVLMVLIPFAALIGLTVHTIGTYKRWKENNKWK